MVSFVAKGSDGTSCPHGDNHVLGKSEIGLQVSNDFLLIPHILLDEPTKFMDTWLGQIGTCLNALLQRLSVSVEEYLYVFILHAGNYLGIEALAASRRHLAANHQKTIFRNLPDFAVESGQVKGSDFGSRCAKQRLRLLLSLMNDDILSGFSVDPGEIAHDPLACEPTLYFEAIVAAHEAERYALPAKLTDDP